MRGVDVVRAGHLSHGGITPGIFREKAFETSGALLSKSTVSAGTVSSWHHHAARDLFGFVVSGTLRLEFKEAEPVDITQGDFFHVSPGLVHRDVNPGKASVEIVNILLGEGPAVVNVD